NPIQPKIISFLFSLRWVQQWMTLLYGIALTLRMADWPWMLISGEIRRSVHELLSIPLLLDHLP
ncbi:MAG TPA: hypothetical protein VKG67_04375, partial [Gallionellaceae bacterium]|nr:hypothetical protein [Gallionellaceae bacterium]